MYKVKYLQEELTSLFRTRILEDGNPAEDAMDYLGNIDFHALTQAVQDKARTAYTYITQGMQEKPSTIAARSCLDKRPPFCMWRTTRARWRLPSPPGRWSCGCWRT